MRKLLRRISPFFLVLSVLLTGCIQVRHVPEEDEAEQQASEYQLTVTDTIGVLAGDSNLVFGDISDVSYSSSGDIVLLDRMNGTVSFFSAEGDYIASLGGLGEAPWEFSWATSFAPMYDGRLLVSDYAGRKIVEFSDTLSFTGIVTGYQHTSPAMLKPLPDGTFIGRDTEMWQDEQGELHGENQIRRFNADSAGYVTEYLASPMFITLLDDGLDVKPASLLSTASVDGTVYCAVASDSLYEVTGFTTAGEEILTISEPWERVEKTPEEIAEEGSVTAMETDEDGTRTPVLIEIEVNPCYNAISNLCADDQGRLWVRLGSEAVPTFRVYDHTGEFLFTATCPDLWGNGRQVRFQTRHGGIVAWDTSPEDYPKVYLLELSRVTPE